MDLYTYKFNLTRVIDGDTLVGNIDLGFKMMMFDQHLRLWGIDTPEIRGIQKVQGKLVKLFVQQSLLDQDIIISSKGKDNFGRILSIVYYGNTNIKINLNNLLLDLGLASVY